MTLSTTRPVPVTGPCADCGDVETLAPSGKCWACQRATCEHPRPYHPGDERLIWRCDDCQQNLMLNWSSDGDSTWWDAWS